MASYKTFPPPQPRETNLNTLAKQKKKMVILRSSKMEKGFRWKKKIDDHIKPEEPNSVTTTKGRRKGNERKKVIQQGSGVKNINKIPFPPAFTDTPVQTNRVKQKIASPAHTLPSAQTHSNTTKTLWHLGQSQS